MCGVISSDLPDFPQTLRKNCKCPCHGPWGAGIVHIVACCRPDPEVDTKPYESKITDNKDN